MATPITGPISFSSINTALGLGSSTALNLGNTTVRQLTNQLTGSISMNNAHASAYVSGTTANLNVFASGFGSPGTVANYKLLIPAGVVVGGTSGNPALNIGQFASGSSIVVNNYGSIQGYGGAAGAAGGDAIYANYPNQTVTVNNQSGGTIYGGGGGGGPGGTGGSGGTGGAGGQGYYVTSGYNYQYSPCYYAVTYYCYCCCGSSVHGTGWTWNNTGIFNTTAHTLPGQTITIGGVTYIQGPFQEFYGNGNWEYSIGQYYSYNVYTSGGAGGGGGAGGAGGAGGVGQGYGQNNAVGAGGSAGGTGAGGSAGGVNAGAGGTGGTGGAGGSGGTGGTWGTSGGTGGAGGTGNTGGTGASGNYTGGSGGATGLGGSGGGSGGAAGRYLVKGSSSVTLNNAGTILGGLA